MQRIKNAAEAAKIDLTLIPNVVIELPYIEERKGKPVDLRIPLTREQLNALTGDLVDRTFEICDRVLAEKGIARSEHRRGDPGRRPEPHAAGAAEDPGALRQAAAQGRAPRRVRGAGRGAAGRLAGQHRRGDAARRAVDAHRLRAAQRAVPEDHREELASSR